MIRREKRGPLWLTKRERPANFADRGNFAAPLRARPQRSLKKTKQNQRDKPPIAVARVSHG